MATPAEESQSLAVQKKMVVAAKANATNVTNVTNGTVQAMATKTHKKDATHAQINSIEDQEVDEDESESDSEDEE